MSGLRRLDAELVRRKLARSREAAQDLITSGLVKVDGVVSLKAARQVTETISIVVNATEDHWVSRGAYKLLGALDAFAEHGLTLSGKNVLDAGASTGGFTQVCLARGASNVAAVDVGYGQLAWSVRQDERVFNLERFNVRNLSAADIPFPVDVVVADLSFISLKTVLPAIRASVTNEADLVLMVKPQFEVGKSEVGEGVVTDPELRKRAVVDVIAAAQELGAGLVDVCASPLPGPSGNVEYFVWLKVGLPSQDEGECSRRVADAVEKGPQ